MNGMLPFFKKEWKELFYTHKILIFAALFLLIGMMSPLTAKLLPELLDAMTVEGMMIQLPNVTYVDSYVQFFKNTSTFAYFVLVIAFAGTICQEISNGTLVLLCSKGLSRTTVFITKYFTAVILWTGSVVLGVATQVLYTYFLFGTHHVVSFTYGFIGIWVFGLFLLAITLLGSVLSNQMYSSFLFSGTAILICFFLNMIPSIQAYNPLAIASIDVLSLAEGIHPKSFYRVILVIAITILISFGIGIHRFQKREL